MDSPSTAPTGTIIGGRYLLRERIGRGGMASVWRAEHLMLKRDVAVKFLELDASLAEGVRERFLREARIAAQIHHRNVVQVLDFGATPDGRPYMVMEILAGRTLASRLAAEAPLPTIEALRIAARLLAGLSAAHEAGIVHRDVKPENVFLVREADDEYPKVIDFGISKVTEKTTRVSSAVGTNPEVIIGTPEYMSPEQARGQTDLDERTDVYSAAVVLYEMLTGARPHEGELPGDVIAKVLTVTPRPLRDHRPDLPAELDAVLAAGLARDREERYPDAAAFRRAIIRLNEALEGDSTGRVSRNGIADSVVPPPASVRAADGDHAPVDRGAPTEERPRPRAGPEDAPAGGARPTLARRRRISLAGVATLLLLVLAAIAWDRLGQDRAMHATPLAPTTATEAPPDTTSAPPDEPAPPPEPPPSGASSISPGEGELRTLPVSPPPARRRRADGLLRDPGF